MRVGFAAGGKGTRSSARLPAQSSRFATSVARHALIGERSPQGGCIRVTFDGRSHTMSLHAARTRTRQVLFVARALVGDHRLTIRVLSGTVRLEGYAFGSRTG
jgi:hypothetical protein